MSFNFVETILEELGLQNPTLEILEANTNPYQAILYQHKGVFNASDTSFVNSDAVSARSKFLSVIQLARHSNSSLLVSPEYSSPWQVIRDILTNVDRQPGNGKLWALGCESITPDEIRQLITDYRESENVIIHFEEVTLNQVGNFLDPLCYLFRTTRNTTNEEVLVCLVQFKTQHMGVRQTAIERDNYIPGEQIYIFRNAAESIYLFTLICSEALIFDVSNEFIQQTGERWEHTPYLILNIQLNPSPNHPDFRQFRRKILQYERKEIITLNWASGTQIALDGNQMSLDHFPGSGFYTDVDGIDFARDNELIENHSRGLYYTFQKPKFHVFHINGANDTFHIRNSKPFQGNGPMALRRRNGPQVIACYEFLANNDIQPATNIDDGLQGFLNLRGSTNATLRGGTLNSFEKERLISLSAGEIEQKDDQPWFRADRMRVCILEDDGIICRLTFAQDFNGNATRTDFLDKLERLGLIIQMPANVPASISFLVGNNNGVMFFHNGTKYLYNFNLVAADNRNKATGAFCGRLSKPEATRKFNKLTKLFTDTDQQRKRVVVWYEPTLGTIESIYDSNPPSVKDDYSTDPRSYKKES